MTLSAATQRVLAFLDSVRVARELRVEAACTGYSRVELDNLESSGGPPSVLNPLEAGRSASSGLSR